MLEQFGTDYFTGLQGLILVCGASMFGAFIWVKASGGLFGGLGRVTKMIQKFTNLPNFMENWANYYSYIETSTRPQDCMSFQEWLKTKNNK